MLHDRNTLEMVAEHWGCSVGAVEWQIGSGALRYIRIGRKVLLTREDVEACYAKCAIAGQLPGAAMKRRRMKQGNKPGEKLGGLRDRNTVSMVADHWGCSTATVHRLIKNGTLPCLYLGGVIRITREQVEACEAACDTSKQTELAQRAVRQMRSELSATNTFELGQKIRAGMKQRQFRPPEE